MEFMHELCKCKRPLGSGIMINGWTHEMCGKCNKSIPNNKCDICNSFKKRERNDNLSKL